MRARSAAPLVTVLAAALATAAAALPAAHAASVPVLNCKTTYGAGVEHAKLPRSVTVSTTPALAARLAAYANPDMMLLAPRGFSCSAAVGADGSVAMTVRGNGGRVVTGDAIPVCQGCVAFTVCPWWPDALKKFDPTMTCDARPAGERSVKLSAHLVAYEDPPRGAEPRTHGIVSYDYGPDRGNAMTGAACALTDAERPLCTVILNDFAMRMQAHGF